MLYLKLDKKGSFLDVRIMDDNFCSKKAKFRIGEHFTQDEKNYATAAVNQVRFFLSSKTASTMYYYKHNGESRIGVGVKKEEFSEHLFFRRKDIIINELFHLNRLFKKQGLISILMNYKKANGKDNVIDKKNTRVLARRHFSS